MCRCYMLTYQDIATSIKYCMTTILYQRGVYEKEYFMNWSFNKADVYELFEPEAEKYLCDVTATIKSYLKVQKWIRVVLAIYADSSTPIERWEFNVKTVGEQEQHTLQRKLDTLLRNIKATSSYTKILDSTHRFKVLFYIDPDLETLPNLGLSSDRHVEVPSDWGHAFRGLRGHYNLGIRFQSQDY